MECRKAAQQIIKSNNPDDSEFLKIRKECGELNLARALREICYEFWTTDPGRVAGVVAALERVAENCQEDEVFAHLEWTRGIGHLVGGRLEQCLVSLEAADRKFLAIGQIQSAAATRVSRLYALALLGRYEEAVECGMLAREVFLSENDIHSLAKIEHNLGNLFVRRDQYAEAEQYFLPAFKRFVELGDQSQAAMLENNLGFVLAAQNRFQEAGETYRSALARAEDHGLDATAADIRASVGTLNLYQGRYGDAMRFYERAARDYITLGMPHHSASVEVDLADLYLELNMLPEAIELFRRAGEIFRNLGARAEMARCTMGRARAHLRRGDRRRAAPLFAEAREIFEREGNEISSAAIRLFMGADMLEDGEGSRAEHELRASLSVFEKGGSVRLALIARHFLAEIEAARGNIDAAIRILQENLRLSADRSRQIEYLSLVSLGRLTDDPQLLLRAVELAENLRGALAAEEFRMAFLADKGSPFDELVRISSENGEVEAAFEFHERGRARALRDRITGSFPIAVSDESRVLRERLNWIYSRMTRRTETFGAIVGDRGALRREAERLEWELAETNRRSAAAGPGIQSRDVFFDKDQIIEMLAGATMIEYFVGHRGLAAFVIDGDGLRLVDGLASISDISELAERYVFQLGTARAFGRMTESARAESTRRLMKISSRLHAILIEPLNLSEGARLVIAPTGPLHQIPFHALAGPDGFLAERHEITFVPGASVFGLCRAAVKGKMRFANAVLTGFADAGSFLVDEEIGELQQSFESPTVLTGEFATVHGVMTAADGADLLHIACHGSFRADNPAFSSLTLADGRLTAVDAATLRLNNGFVVLSSCESARGRFVSGDESVGFASAFLAAGARGLLLSRWTIEDAATRAFMRAFYGHLIRTGCPLFSLKATQRGLIDSNTHPYHWAPYSLFGAW